MRESREKAEAGMTCLEKTDVLLLALPLQRTRLDGINLSLSSLDLKAPNLLPSFAFQLGDEKS